MIRRLIIENFRGVQGRVRLEFAQLTLLSGRNSLGKTTVFDAIDWTLFGPSWRLADATPTVNLYRRGGQPYVALSLPLPGGEEVWLERTPAGPKWNGELLTERELASKLLTDMDLFPAYTRDLGSRIRRLIYLPQDTIREFISSTENEGRRAILDAISGVPYAATVDSSIRKIRERLSETKQQLEERISDSKAEEQQLSQNVAMYDEKIAEIKDTEVARLSKLVGASDAAEPAEVLERARQHLRETQQDLRTLQDLTVFEREIRKDIDKTRERIAESKNSSDSLETRLAETEKDLAATDAQIVAVKQTARGLTNTKTKLADRLQEHHSELRKLEEASSARLRLSTSQVTLKEVSAERLLVAQERTKLENEIAAMDVAIGESRDALEHVSHIRNTLKQTSELRTRLNGLGNARQKTNTRLTNLELEKGSVEETLSAAVKKRDTADAALRRGRALASAQKKLFSLVAEVSELAFELDLHQCPVCGSHFESSQLLVAHSAKSGGGTSDTELAAAVDHASGAQAEATRLKNELESLQRQIAEVRDELNELSEETEHAKALLDESVPDVRTEGRSLTSVEQEVNTAELRVAELERQRTKHTSELAALRRRELEATSLESHAQEEVSVLAERLTRATEGTRVSHRREEIDLSIQRVRDALAEVEDREAATRKDLQGLEGKYERQQKALEDLKANVARARSDQVAAEERIATAVQQLEERFRSAMREKRAFQVGEMMQTIEDARRRSLEVEEELERELPGLQMVVRLRESAVWVERLATVRKEIDHLTAELDQVRRAEQRFGAIATSLQRRSSQEAKTAIESVGSAIQECVDSCSSYRHLNRIDIRTNGAVLLSDSYLAGRPVTPELYASTGHLNLIALAVFLGIALRQSVSRLGFILLDEPVQNLDDLNFLGFISFLKRLVREKQVLLSTADSNVAEILSRHVRRWNDNEFAHYRWNDFTAESGPSFARVAQPIPLEAATG